MQAEPQIVETLLTLLEDVWPRSPDVPFLHTQAAIPKPSSSRSLSPTGNLRKWMVLRRPIVWIYLTVNMSPVRPATFPDLKEKESQQDSAVTAPSNSSEDE